MSPSAPEPRVATVYIETGDDRPVVFDRLLARSGLLERVATAAGATGRPRSTLSIAIKPNLMAAPGGAAGPADRTDPALVERLVAALTAEGYADIAVVESRYAGGPAVEEAARAAGYRADGYRIVDVSAETEPFDYGGVLGPHVVGRTWLRADFRISFAKAKTNWQCFFSGALANLYGCLPEPDKLTHYHGAGHEFQECCVLMAHRLPVHFGLIDAWVGGDGGGSHARSRGERDTRTFLAGEDLLALDWVAGEKMGLAPERSFVVHEALLRWGRVHIVRRGNVTTWRPWDNVRPAKVVGVHLLEPAMRRPAVRGALRRLGSRGRRLAAWTVQ